MKSFKSFLTEDAFAERSMHGKSPVDGVEFKVSGPAHAKYYKVVHKKSNKSIFNGKSKPAEISEREFKKVFAELTKSHGIDWSVSEKEMDMKQGESFVNDLRKAYWKKSSGQSMYR